MSTKEQSKIIINLARKGRLDGDTGLRAVMIEAVKMQLDLNFNEKPYFRSALWEATWKNHEACVKLLFEKGAQVDFKDYQGRTPLHEAAYYGHMSLIEFFLDKGHPVDVMDQFNQTPLFRAVEGRRHEVVELLIKRKASTNFLDSDYVTVQHCAAFSGLPSMADWLTYKGSWKNRFAIEEQQNGERAEKPTTATLKAAGAALEPSSSPTSPTSAAPSPPIAAPSPAALVAPPSSAPPASPAGAAATAEEGDAKAMEAKPA